MTMTEMKDLIESIHEEYDWDYAYIGIRTQDEPFELGPFSHCSHVWDDGEDTGEELNGACATGIDSRMVEAHCSGYYCGAHCAIIAGNSVEYGEDEGELIIADPVVVRIIR